MAKQGDVVISMLPDSPDVEAVAFGPDGVIENIRPGCTYVDMSTISPTVSERIAKEAKARGIKVLDAPVSGGDVGAIQGTLSIMVRRRSGDLRRIHARSSRCWASASSWSARTAPDRS